MKKLLSILGAAALCATSSFSVVSCMTDSNTINTNAVSLSNVSINAQKLFYQSSAINSWADLLNYAWNLLTTDTASGINWQNVKKDQLNITIYDNKDHIINSSNINMISNLGLIKVQYSAIVNYPNQTLTGTTSKFVLDNWNDKIMSQEFTKYFATHKFVLDGDAGHDAKSAFDGIIEETKKDSEIGNFAASPDLEITAVDDSFQSIQNTGNTDQGQSPIKGVISLKLVDNKNGETIINANDQGQSFTVGFSNDETDSYISLAEKLESKDEADHSINIRQFTLAQLIPSSYFDSLGTQIKKLLSEIDLGKWITDFLDPVNGFAKDLPSDMPSLKMGPNWLNDPDNKGCLTFAHDIAGYFMNNYNIDITRGDFSAQNVLLKSGTSSSGYKYKALLTFDTYNVIKNLMPDLIHFHRYLLLMKPYAGYGVKNVENYMLAFLKYLSAPVGSMNLVDGFENVNAYYKSNHSRTGARTEDGAPSIKYNFDNFLFDLVSPFTIGNANSGFSTLFNIEVKTRIGGFWHSDVINDDSFDRIYTDYSENSKFCSPYVMMIKNPIDEMFKNHGQDVTQDLKSEIWVSLHYSIGFWSDGYQQVPISVSMLDVHQAELKHIITDTLGYKDMALDTVSITQGVLVAEYQSGNKTWHEAQSLDELLKPTTTSMRFEIKYLAFSITSKKVPSIKVSKNMYNIYLEF